jgi:two-component system OmpR family response regulator
MSRVLLVGDDRRLACVMKDVLSRDGFQVESVPHPRAERDLTQVPRCGVAIVDWNASDVRQGLQLAQLVRAQHPAAGVIACTEQRRFAERWRVLIQACDDYLTKPCAPSELLARVRMLSARSSRVAQQPGVLVWGPLRVDCLRQSVEIDGSEIALQPLQMRLLGYLMRHQGRCVTQDELREHVFRVAQSPCSTSIARQMSVLRGRLGAAASLIVTVSGGYGIGISRPVRVLSRKACRAPRLG